MKKILLFVLLLYVLSMAQAWPPITNFTYFYTPSLTQQSEMTAAAFVANQDSVQGCTDRIIDEMNQNCVHFNQGTQNHDSTVNYVQIDTLSGNIISADTIDTRVVTADSLSFGTAGFFHVDTGSFTCTLSVYSGVSLAGDTIRNVHYIKSGRLVSFTIPHGTLAVTGIPGGCYFKGFPSSIIPSIRFKTGLQPSASTPAHIEFNYNGQEVFVSFDGSTDGNFDGGSCTYYIPPE